MAVSQFQGEFITLKMIKCFGCSFLSKSTQLVVLTLYLLLITLAKAQETKGQDN